MEFNFFFYNYFHISIYNEQIWTICWKGRWRSKKENPCRMPWNWCLSYQVRFTRTQRFISKERAKRSSSNSSNRPIWSTRPTSSARTTRTTRPIWKGQQESEDHSWQSEQSCLCQRMRTMPLKWSII